MKGIQGSNVVWYPWHPRNALEWMAAAEPDPKPQGQQPLAHRLALTWPSAFQLLWDQLGAKQTLENKGRLLKLDPSLRSRKFPRKSRKGSSTGILQPTLHIYPCLYFAVPPVGNALSPCSSPPFLFSHLITCPHPDPEPSSLLPGRVVTAPVPESLLGARPQANPFALGRS